jgi:hypothetical protein
MGLNGKIIGFNIDVDFNNCLDALMIVDMKDLPFEMRLQLSKDTGKIPSVSNRLLTDQAYYNNHNIRKAPMRNGVEPVSEYIGEFNP